MYAASVILLPQKWNCITKDYNEKQILFALKISSYTILCPCLSTSKTKAKHNFPSKSLLAQYYALVYHSLLQFNLGLFLCHQPATNLPITEKSSPVDL